MNGPNTPRPWYREPLLHFLLFGLAVYGVDIALGADVPSEEPASSELVPQEEPQIDRTIVIDDALVDDIARELEAAIEHVPSETEVEWAVNSWIDDEMLVREALALGLERDDPIIRARLAQKMSFVIESREVAAVPDEEAIRAWYESNIHEFRLETQVTFRHLFVEGLDESAQARVDALAAELMAGADPIELGHSRPTPPFGPVLRGRTPERLTELFGADFAAAVSEAPLDTWFVQPSRDGWHVVRVEARREARTIPFDEARNRAAAGWQRERIQEANDQAVEELRALYTVEGWPR